MRYPWRTTFDKNNAEGVWDKYNIGAIGGAVFLINSSVVIVSVNPKISELKELLIKNLS